MRVKTTKKLQKPKNANKYYLCYKNNNNSGTTKVSTSFEPTRLHTFEMLITRKPTFSCIRYICTYVCKHIYIYVGAQHLACKTFKDISVWCHCVTVPDILCEIVCMQQLALPYKYVCMLAWVGERKSVCAYGNTLICIYVCIFDIAWFFFIIFFVHLWI